MKLFALKPLSASKRHPPALAPWNLSPTLSGVSLGLSLALVISLSTLPVAAQSRFSSSQLRSEVSRLTVNDQRQDLRLYNLEKDVDYLQKKGSYQPRGPSQTSAKAPVQPLPTFTNYTVRPGDTIWRIAMNHRVSPGEIMQINGLKSHDVNAGQTLRIPAAGSSQPPPTQTATRPSKFTPSPAPKSSAAPGGTHIIQKGETFSQIAQQHGISQNALKQANPQVNPDVIIVGARLKLPSGTKSPSQPPASSRSDSSVTVAADPQRHTVRPGETLSSIAAAHGVSATAIQRSNALANPDRLSIGQVLSIPSRGSSVVARTSSTPKRPTPSYPDTPSEKSPTSSSTSTSSPGPAPQSNPRGVLSYRVHSTDTLESIASTFGTTPEKIRELNRKPAGSKVTPDEEILVPAMGAVSL